jgi:hypothetical protein
MYRQDMVVPAEPTQAVMQHGVTRRICSAEDQHAKFAALAQYVQHRVVQHRLMQRVAQYGAEVQQGALCKVLNKWQHAHNTW